MATTKAPVSASHPSLVRRHGQFDACEDAVQEALLAATVSGPARVSRIVPGPG